MCGRDVCGSRTPSTSKKPAVGMRGPASNSAAALRPACKCRPVAGGGGRGTRERGIWSELCQDCCRIESEALDHISVKVGSRLNGIYRIELESNQVQIKLGKG